MIYSQILYSHFRLLDHFFKIIFAYFYLYWRVKWQMGNRGNEMGMTCIKGPWLESNLKPRTLPLCGMSSNHLATKALQLLDHFVNIFFKAHVESN